MVGWWAGAAMGLIAIFLLNAIGPLSGADAVIVMGVCAIAGAILEDKVNE